MTDNHSEPMSQAALERAVSQAFPILYHRLNCRYRDPQLAEEVSWDCLTQAFELWQQDPGYFTRHDLTAWSTRRANWRAVDRLRERGRHAPLPEDYPLEDDHHPVVLAATSTDPDDEQLAADRARAWEALQALDERDRYLLCEHFYESTSDQTLGAELFGDAASAQALGLRVWRLRQKALGRLEQKFLEAGIDPEHWGGQAV